MEGTTPSGAPQPKPPSTLLPALVVVGALVGFALLLFLANFSMTTATPGGGPDRPVPFAKGKGKGKGKVSKLPEEKLWVAGAQVQRPEPPEAAKNVVLVLLSTARKDHFTPYGAEPELTPYLQEVASKGARFADALTASPFSRSAFTALLTGRHPAEVDMVVPGAAPETAKSLAPEIETLAERMVAGGWQAYGVTANFHLNTDSGLAQGFDRYRNSQPNGFNPQVRTEGARVISLALEMLGKRSEEEAKRPFFLQLNLVDAQAPLRSVPELAKRFDEDKPNAAYRVAIHELDTHIQTLMEELSRLGHSVDSDTYLVVVSDHGEGLSDPAHHGRAHGVLLYETSVGIPWIVAGPDIPANRIISGLASGTDVMPTVLGLVDLAAPDGIDGQSWAALLKGQGDRTSRQRAFSDTWWSTANRASIWTEKMQCQKDFGTTGIEDAFATGCFDRTTDPEFRDLKQDPALLAELDEWRSQVAANVTEAKAGKAKAAPPPEQPDEAPEQTPDAEADAVPDAAEEEEEEDIPEPGEQAG